MLNCGCAEHQSLIALFPRLPFHCDTERDGRIIGERRKERMIDTGRERETVSVSYEEEDGAILHCRRKNDGRIHILARKRERGGEEDRGGKSASPNTNRFESSSQLLQMSCPVYIAFARTMKIFSRNSHTENITYRYI